MVPCLPVVSHDRMSVYVHIPGGLRWSEVMSGRHLKSLGDVRAKCPDCSPGGSRFGGLDVPDGAVAGQPGSSGPGSVGTIPSGRSTGKEASGSGTHAARP